MKIFVLLFVILSATVPFVERVEHRSQASDNEAVRVPLESYLKGHATGNPDFIRKAFLPEARVMALRDGKLLNLSSEEFATRFNGSPAPDEAQRKRRIESVEISGNAAAARIVLDYPTVTFTDYMSLLKIDGEWKIASKVFYAQPKAK